MAYVKIRPRRGTASQWEYANPILSEGEMAFEVPETGVGTGPVNIKQGDGQNSWNNLPYAFNAAYLNTKVDDLANTVATYDATIQTLSQSVASMESQVQNIRKIDIQSTEPSTDLILGQIWINTDMVTGSMTVAPSNVSLEVGASTRLALTSTLSAVDSIEWKASDETIVQITNATMSGATITANLSSGSSFVTVTASAKLNGQTIYQASSKVTCSISGGLVVTPEAARVVIGNYQNLNLTNSLSSYDTIQWSSSANYYATIEESSDTNAKVKALTSGSATIYARAMLNGSAIATGTSLITIVGMKLNKTSAQVGIGESTILALENTMIDGTDYDTITWDTSGANVATISASSKTSATVVGVAAGQCYITATATLEGQLVQKVQCIVGVTGNLTLDKNVMSMMVGQTGGLTVTNTLGEGNYDRIAWTSSEETIARINSSTNSSAIIEGRAAGSAVITVTAYLNSQFVTSASCTVTVSGTIEIDQGSALNINQGSTTQLTLTNTLSSASYSRIRWVVDAADIVSIVTQSNTDCTIEGLGIGQATITAIAVDTEGTTVASDAIVITVNPV